MNQFLDIEQESKSGGGQKITRLGGFFNRNKKVEKPPQEDMSHLPPGMRLLIVLSCDCTQTGHTVRLIKRGASSRWSFRTSSA